MGSDHSRDKIFVSQMVKSAMMTVTQALRMDHGKPLGLSGLQEPALECRQQVIWLEQSAARTGDRNRRSIGNERCGSRSRHNFVHVSTSHERNARFRYTPDNKFNEVIGAVECQSSHDHDIYTIVIYRPNTKVD
jgi:hypothetical protein